MKGRGSHDSGGGGRTPGVAALLVLSLPWALVVVAPGIGAAQDGEVFPVGSSDGDAILLAHNMTTNPFLVQTARFMAHPPVTGVHGLGQGIAGFPIDGQLLPILTTGQAHVAVADPDEFPDGFALGGGNVRGDTDFDVTILEIDFIPPLGATCLRFDFRFLSHEYPDWVGSAFNDAFIAELNVTSWITSGSQIIAPNNFAFDANGDVISINTTGATSMSAAHAEGSGYGGATPLLTASTPIPPDQEGTLYLSIFDQGDMILDSAVFLDHLRFTFDTGDACLEGAQPADPDPIVFLPGITGSVLADAATGDEIWPSPGQMLTPNLDRHLQQLMLDTDGQTPHPEHGVEVVATDIVRSILTADIYAGFIDQLAAAGYVEGENLAVVPLDWRRSAEENALVLLDAIDDLGGGGKVNVVAHSQGGLVTAAALSNPVFDNIGKVNRVVTLGTPFLGSAKALGVLEYAEPCLVRFGACLLNRARMQEISQNLPGFLELLPSRNYDLGVRTALVTEDGVGLDFDAVRDRLDESGRNMPLLEAADAFHQQYDAWNPADPDVELFRIAASGLPTIYAVQERATWTCTVRRWFGSCEEANDIELIMGSGDETVATASAGLHNDAGFDLRGSGVTGWAARFTHGGMATDPRIVQEVLRVLQSPAEHQAASSAAGTPERPVIQSFAAQQADEDDVILDEPMALAGVEVFAQGPVEATMTGADGRLVSTVDAADLPDVEAAIGDPLPGAAAFETRFSRTVFATEDGSYTTTLAAGSEGELAVLLRAWDDDAIVTTVAYPPFGVSDGTVVTVEHAVPFGGAPALLVDDNGDGTVDLVIEAASVVDGDVAADRIPPVTSAEVVRITDPDDPLQGHALVELSATDDGGSGVDRIEYAILPDEQEGVYDGTPLLLAPGQSLLARAIDRAGNVEVPPLLVEIDEGTDDRELVDGFATPQFIGSARLVEPGQQHWWGFELTSATHDFALQGLQADYDLAVYDEDDQLVAATTERGTQSKQLRLDLEAGRYFALVSGHEGAYDPDSDYLLRVTRLGRGHSK